MGSWKKKRHGALRVHLTSKSKAEVDKNVADKLELGYTLISKGQVPNQYWGITYYAVMELSI